MGDVITLQGIIPAIATPFQPDGSLDEEALRRLVRFEIEAGVGGLIPTGSTGEFFSLTHEERKRVVEVVSSEADGAVPVIPHTGALTTRETVELSQHAEQNGASALMVIPPYYEPLAWDELLAHYQAVSDAVSIPIIYYHMPAATGLEVTPEQFDELAQIENIRYTKDSTGNAVELLGLFKALKGKLSVLNGEDKLTFLAFASGAKGGVWGSATFFPSLAVELYDALVTNQDLVKARGVWDRIWTILDTLGEASYQGAVKAGLDIVGVPVGQTRLPIKPASKEYYTKLRGVLRDAGVDVVG
ncbi:MAG: dihydrodipicolinate synthase family protein [Nostocoides sp.]